MRFMPFPFSRVGMGWAMVGDCLKTSVVEYPKLDSVQCCQGQCSFYCRSVIGKRLGGWAVVGRFRVRFYPISASRKQEPIVYTKSVCKRPFPISSKARIRNTEPAQARLGVAGSQPHCKNRNRKCVRQMVLFFVLRVAKQN